MGNCGSVAEQRSLVENFHLIPDSKFIQHLEMYCGKTTKERNYNKLNESVNLYEDTLLHYAVFHYKEALCEFLISKGADPYKMNKRKKSPYDLAKSKGLTKLTNLFEEKAKGLKPSIVQK